MMKRLGMEKGEAIEHPWVTRAIENAQRKVEGRNFDIRKQLLEYDDVANDQRKVIYEQRNELVDEYIPPQSLEEMWDVSGLEQRLKADFALDAPIQQWLDADDKLYEEKLREKILDELNAAYKAKEEMVGEQVLRQFEKAVMLQN